jgi:SAM-dependent methyltransferase
MNINLGCGELNFPNCFNVDLRQTSIVNQIVDLSKHPWPFENEQYDNVYAYDIIEHLEDVISCMEEIHRIIKPNGKVYIRTSYWKMESAFVDPTHRHFFTLRSFDYFDPSTFLGQKYSHYSKSKFKVSSVNVDGEELMFVLEKIL